MTGSTGTTGTIGYYVHHVGHGHRHRATALARHLAATGGPQVTGLSSLPRPDGWPGEWVELARDDDGDIVCPGARGRLHWAPLRHAGLRSRSAAVSRWIEAADPGALVVDVSVEVALLARLHGVPVVSTVLPGCRDDDPHRLGLDVADELVAFWPAEAHDMLHGVPYETKDRVRCLGALSRFEVTDVPPPAPSAGGRRAVLMLGGGGHDDLPADLPTSWEWTVLGGDRWVDDPRGALRDADVVVTHAGQNALAEVASVRRPAVVVPQDRPHDEQRTTAAALRDGGWPVVVTDRWPSGAAGAETLEKAAVLDGRRWADWCDGQAVARFADVVREVAGR